MNSAVISARYRETHYPIGRFVLHRARALNLSRSELAQRLGYRDIGNAQRSLGVALTTGTVPIQMRSHLAGALEIDETLLDAVINATARQQGNHVDAVTATKTMLFAEPLDQPHINGSSSENYVAKSINYKAVDYFLAQHRNRLARKIAVLT